MFIIRYIFDAVAIRFVAKLRVRVGILHYLAGCVTPGIPTQPSPIEEDEDGERDRHAEYTREFSN